MNKLTNFLTVLVAFLAMLHANGSTAAAEQFSDGAAPVESSFAGAFGGLEYGGARSSGDLTIATIGGPTFVPGISFDDDDTFGVFAGYNFQSNRFVYGAEARYLTFSDFNSLPFEIDGILDIRGRAGLATGSFLFYGTLGWSWAFTSSFTTDGDLDGLNYGLGVEFNVTDRLMISLDYTFRDMQGDFNRNVAYDGDVETLSGRVGLRF